MTVVNTIYFLIHLLFNLPLIFTLIFAFITKERVVVNFILILTMLLYFILLTSGISYMQGDRLVLPSLPIWVILYITIVYYWYDKIIKKNNTGNSSILNYQNPHSLSVNM